MAKAGLTTRFDWVPLRGAPVRCFDQLEHAMSTMKRPFSQQSPLVGTAPEPSTQMKHLTQISGLATALPQPQQPGAALGSFVTCRGPEPSAPQETFMEVAKPCVRSLQFAHTNSRCSSRDIRVPFFLESVVVGEPSPKKA